MRFRVLGSGSSGNTTVVESGDTRILIDAGLGAREMAERLETAGVDPASLAAIVLSHEHTDHSRGAASFAGRRGARSARASLRQSQGRATAAAGERRLPTVTLELRRGG